MKKNIHFLLFLLFLSCASPLDGSKKGDGSASSASESAFPVGASWIAPPPAPALPVNPQIYYVSPSGSDSNSGSIASPFKTLSHAVSVMQKGEVVYLRGGVYSITSTVGLSKTGDESNYFYIWAYTDEHPVLDFSGESSSAMGLSITGSRWYVKGVEIKNTSRAGIRITGSYNVIENCSIHDIKESGLYIGLNKDNNLTEKNDGTKAAFNRIINCDSYMNIDIGGSTGDGGNADGFACKLNPGNGNYFYGCRAWSNSDDGWDLYLADYPVMIEHCWTWHNGDPNDYAYSGGAWAGNGNGFKVGGGDAAKTGQHYSHGRHILKNCIAFDMNYGNTANVKAFDRNNNYGGVTLYNCLAFNSRVGFSFNSTPDDGSHHTLKNCVSFGCASSNYSLSSDAVQENNSWNLALTADASDFISILTADAKASRKSDGSLPDNNFGKLTAGSDLIDKGVNVGIPYLGAKPDLGAFEKE